MATTEIITDHDLTVGWCVAIVLSKVSVPERPTNLDKKEQGLCALAVGAGGLFGHFFSCLSFLSSFSLFLGDGSI